MVRDPLNPDPVNPLAECFRFHSEIAATAQPISLPQMLVKFDGSTPWNGSQNLSCWSSGMFYGCRAGAVCHGLGWIHPAL